METKPDAQHAGRHLLTVKEFAQLAGISQQAVYLRLETTLQPYFRIVGGRKRIDSAALSLYGIQEIQADASPIQAEIQEIQAENSRDSSPMQAEIQEIQADDSRNSSPIQADAERLQASLQAAEQRAEAAERLADAERKRADSAESMIETLTEALQAAQRQADLLARALTAEQALHAGTIQRLEIKPNAVTAADAMPTEAAERKPGILARLFGRR